MKKGNLAASSYKKRPIQNLFQRPDGQWAIDIRIRTVDEVKRVRQAFDTKKSALEYLAVLRGKRAALRLGLEAPKRPSADPAFEDFGERFLSTYSTRQRPKTAASHRSAFNALSSSPEFRGKRLSEITAGTIARYMARRGETRPVSANRELSFLKLMFRKAVEWEEAGTNPAAGERKFEEHARQIRVLTADEAGRLLTAAAIHLRPILRVLLSTAMRKTEVLKLAWSTAGEIYEPETANSIIDLEAGTILIPAAVAKNHKSRTLSLSPELSTLFAELRGKAKPKDELVFPYKDFKRSFRSAADEAKIKGLRIHDLRHTALTWMLDAGVDIKTVQEIAGHSDIEMTARYLHSNDSKKKAAIEKLSEKVKECEGGGQIRKKRRRSKKPPRWSKNARSGGQKRTGIENRASITYSPISN